MGAPRVTVERESELRSVSATINYTRPRAERLHIDVRDCSRIEARFVAFFD